MVTIPAQDHGQIRVFASAKVIDKTAEGIAAAFGADLDLDYVDVVKISDLGDMTLTAYIAEGYDRAPDAVDARAVDAIAGYAVLVLSRASGGVETTLSLAPGLRHVTTYSDAAQIITPQPLPDASAQGIIEGPSTKPAKSNARIGGMVAMYALLAMFVLVILMVWVGG